MNKSDKDSEKDAVASAVDAIVIRRLEGKLEDGLYRNRLGEVRRVTRDDFLEDYPFRDNRLTAYDENGKLYKNRESDFDLIEAV